MFKWFFKTRKKESIPKNRSLPYAIVATYMGVRRLYILDLPTFTYTRYRDNYKEGRFEYDWFINPIDVSIYYQGLDQFRGNLNPIDHYPHDGDLFIRLRMITRGPCVQFGLVYVNPNKLLKAMYDVQSLRSFRLNWEDIHREDSLNNYLNPNTKLTHFLNRREIYSIYDVFTAIKKFKSTGGNPAVNGYLIDMIDSLPVDEDYKDAIRAHYGIPASIVKCA